MNVWREKIRKRERVLGTWLTIDHPVVVEILSQHKLFDFLVIDMEHSPLDFVSQQDMIRIVQLTGKQAYVRIPANEEIFYKRALDAGADGIITPMVKTSEDVQKMIEYSFYPPIGKRGVGLARAQKYGMGFPEYSKRIYDDIVLIAQIEHVEAIDNLKSIISHDRIDGYFIGPYDLSASIGRPGEYDLPEFKELLDKFEAILKQTDKTTGYHIVHPIEEVIAEKIKSGYTFLAYGIDYLFLQYQIKEVLKP